LLLKRQRREIEVECRCPYSRFSAEDHAVSADFEPGKCNPDVGKPVSVEELEASVAEAPTARPTAGQRLRISPILAFISS
jgi:hypothetical protein